MRPNAAASLTESDRKFLSELYTREELYPWSHPADAPAVLARCFDSRGRVVAHEITRLNAGEWAVLVNSRRESVRTLLASVVHTALCDVVKSLPPFMYHAAENNPAALIDAAMWAFNELSDPPFPG
jgi:hypothetical protein